MWARILARWGLAASFATILLALSLNPRPVPAQIAAAPRSADNVALKVQGLTRQEIHARLRSLKNSDIIEIAGRRVTLAQLKAEARKRHQQHLAKAKANALRPSASLSMLRAKFVAEEKVALDASNARARAEFARLAQAGRGQPDHAAATERDVLRRETVELLRRAATASPAERAAIETRAAELLPKARQLKRAP
jgi:hypothetical protein